MAHRGGLGYGSGMQLPGRLSATTLGDVLGALHRERATGALEIVERTGRIHRVHVSAGLVSAVELDRSSPSLADVLRQEDSLDEATLRRSLLRALAQNRLHGEVLVTEFHLSPEVVGRAVRTQLRHRLTALENVPDAELRFRVAIRTPREALRPALLPEVFLHGRRRLRDRLDKSPIAPAARATESAEQRAARRTLGLSSYATKDEVKRAYRDLVRTTHPDLHPRASAEERRELSRRLHAITSAYQTLVA